MEAFVDLVAGGRLPVRPMISHHFPIESASQAYDLITGKQKEPYLGIILTYPEAPTPDLVTDRAVARPVGSEQTLAPAIEVALGVLGAGNFATVVALPAIRKVPKIKLVGIASASGSRAQHAAGQFNFSYAASDDQEITADPQINTVAIFTRHDQHARQTMEGLQAGKHVFCEKPLALSNEELDKILAVLDRKTAAEDAEPGNPLNQDSIPLLMVGYNRRFAPLSVKLSNFLADREEPLAAIFRVNAGFLPPDHWLHDPDVGGGRIIGEGCHFIDYLTFLVGAPPVGVTTAGLPDAGRYHEDNVVITLDFPDGSVGVVMYLANGDRSVPKERLEVFCGGRVATLDDFRSLEVVGGIGGRKRSRSGQDKGHRAAWEAFAAAILAGGPPPIPYDHIFGVNRAAIAAVEALRSGERVNL